MKFDDCSHKILEGYPCGLDTLTFHAFNIFPHFGYSNNDLIVGLNPLNTLLSCTSLFLSLY